MRRVLLLVALLGLVISSDVGAQSTGRSGVQTVSGTVAISNLPATQPVSGTVAVSGAPTITVATCTTVANKTTAVGTTAGNCLASAMTGRRQVTICNSKENAIAAALIKIRVDGTAPVMGTANAGDVLGVGDCFTYSIGTGLTPQCIASGANTYLTSLECQ